MEKVQIVYVDKRTGKNGGKYTRVGYKVNGGATQFVNVPGHQNLTQGEALWDADKKKFIQGTSGQNGKYRQPTPPEDRRSINRSVALREATGLVAAMIRAGHVQDMAEVLELVKGAYQDLLGLLES